LDASCIAAPAGTGCRYGGVQQSYQLFALSGSYAFREKYTLRFGIENLLDEEPPLRGGDPNALPFPIAPTHIGSPFAPDGGTTTGATYDPLGRRGFVSMTMEF
jgi:outer membrane receptor protein involved in Fe transport